MSPEWAVLSTRSTITALQSGIAGDPGNFEYDLTHRGVSGIDTGQIVQGSPLLQYRQNDGDDLNDVFSSGRSPEQAAVPAAGDFKKALGNPAVKPGFQDAVELDPHPADPVSFQDAYLYYLRIGVTGSHYLELVKRPGRDFARVQDCLRLQ